MFLRILQTLLICVSICFAQDPISALSVYPGLGNFSQLLTSDPQLVKTLQTSNNFTLLAPTDDAIAKWRSSNIYAIFANQNLTEWFTEATLAYHLLNGLYPTANIGSEPAFLPTQLLINETSLNESFCLVTGGQRVETMKAGSLTFVSGNKTSSSVIQGDILAGPHGLIHVIDNVLLPPLDVFLTAQVASLSYFVSIAQQWVIWNNATEDTFQANIDQTYFIPNSAAALAMTQNMSIEAQQQIGELVGYHIVSGSVLYSTALTNGRTITTVSGLSLIVTVQEDGTKYINGAKITSPDYLVSDGVMHIIDSVLIIGNTTGPTNSSSSPSPSVTSATPQKRLSAAASAGIGVGVGLVLLALIAGGFLVIKKRRKQQSVQTYKDQPTVPAVYELKDDEILKPTQLETRERPVEIGHSEQIYEM